MRFTETDIPGAFTIDPEKIKDERGFFSRIFCEKEFLKNGIHFKPVQVNVSFTTSRYTLRGLHYQESPHREAKLFRCTRGSVFDVIIDLRQDSPAYLKWKSVELSGKNNRMIFVPEGCAHGFLTLDDKTEVSYAVSEFYTPKAENGVRWNDPAFKINWPAEPQIISEKDRNWPDFKDTLEKNF